MKKILIVLLTCFGLQANDFAQLMIRLQGAAAIPTGYAEDAVSLGYGGNINFSKQFLFPNLELSLTTGYYHFGFKENLPDYDFSFSSIPVLAGLRFNLNDYDFIPYIGLEGGIYISEYFLEIDYGLLGKTSSTTKKTHWGLSPELGFKMNLTPVFDVDVNAKYNRINTVYIARAYLLFQTGFTYKF
ncbi:MAG: hypothetical protein A2000_12345 [Ignavibacteria bacterium GWB2_36_8]|nr:MAG: hypothetical protein A2000_12345 [Ignavibacteria bacterium GWB2_36_8]OGU48572.1 MAG: hypothetical protein A2080_06920 [Ignavibacteria bacterium GWC2_36_12]